MAHPSMVRRSGATAVRSPLLMFSRVVPAATGTRSPSRTGPAQCAWRANRCDNPAVGERDAAQAAQLIRALCEVRDKLISQMTWLEKHDRRLDAAAVRRDVNEAQAHITRLHRRYLGGDVQASQPARQAR